jgi:hypothetical protein
MKKTPEVASDSSFRLPPLAGSRQFRSLSSLFDHAAFFIGASLTDAAICPLPVVPMVTTNVP